MRLRRSDLGGVLVCAVTLVALLALITYSVQQRKQATRAFADASVAASLQVDGILPESGGGGGSGGPLDPLLAASSMPATPLLLLVDVCIIGLSMCFFFLVSWIFFYRTLFQDYEVRMIHSVQVGGRTVKRSADASSAQGRKNRSTLTRVCAVPTLHVRI